MKIHFHIGENPFSYGGKSIFVGGNRKSPPRNGQILRSFEIILPKFHFILPKFYFAPPWKMFVFQRAIRRFLRGGDRAPEVWRAEAKELDMVSQGEEESVGACLLRD